jgi:two-component system, cell cycle response regulator
MKGTEFLLGICGLNRIERMTVASVCSLTHSRPRRYTVLPPERSDSANIMLVDADDPNAWHQWQNSPVHQEGRPALMISRDPLRIDVPTYVLARANFAARLLKILDQITIREFKFVPELVISDASSANTELSLDTAAHTAAAVTAPRALVIDDSVVVRTKMRALLTLHGMRADLAENAANGFALLRAHRYSIIFLDVVMPGTDGYAACRHIKNNVDQAPPIIMLTSRDSSFDKIRGVMAGCTRYLTKPIAVDDLYKVLCEFVPAKIHAPAHIDREPSAVKQGLVWPSPKY